MICDDIAALFHGECSHIKLQTRKRSSAYTTTNTHNTYSLNTYLDAYHLDIWDKAGRVSQVIMSAKSCGEGVLLELCIPENSGWSDVSEVKGSLSVRTENDRLIHAQTMHNLPRHMKARGYNSHLTQNLGVNTGLGVNIICKGYTIGRSMGVNCYSQIWGFAPFTVKP